jgi:hypothetical protein
MQQRKSSIDLVQIQPPGHRLALEANAGNALVVHRFQQTISDCPKLRLRGNLGKCPGTGVDWQHPKFAYPDAANFPGRAIPV